MLQVMQMVEDETQDSSTKECNAWVAINGRAVCNSLYGE